VVSACMSGTSVEGDDVFRVIQLAGPTAREAEEQVAKYIEEQVALYDQRDLGARTRRDGNGRIRIDLGAAQLKGADGVGVPVGWVVGAAA
jgi:hypothetical protein